MTPTYTMRIKHYVAALEAGNCPEDLQYEIASFLRRVEPALAEREIEITHWRRLLAKVLASQPNSRNRAVIHDVTACSRRDEEWDQSPIEIYRDIRHRCTLLELGQPGDLMRQWGPSPLAAASGAYDHLRAERERIQDQITMGLGIPKHLLETPADAAQQLLPPPEKPDEPA